MTVNNELEIFRKESFTMNFKVLSQHFPIGTKGNLMISDTWAKIWTWIIINMKQKC